MSRARLVAARILPLLALSLAACASPPSLYTIKQSAELSWPRQAPGPGVAWVKTIADYRDAGITKGFWARALEFFTGADERRFVRPYGVLIDADERLFVADPGRRVVHCMDLKANRYTVIGAEGVPALRSPIGLAEDDSGHLYITDSQAGAVFVFDIREGTLKPFLSKVIQRPTGIAYNRHNKFLYIVDTTEGRVVAVDSSGRERLRFGSPGDGPEEFNHPADIAVDGRGQVYVTDTLNYTVKVFTPEGSLVTTIGTAGDTMGSLDKPKGVAVDRAGHIYVCDSLLDTVQVFDDSGRFLLAFGGAGIGNGAFWMPSGLFIDSHDYIFVADTYNRRIQVFRFLPTMGEGVDASPVNVPPTRE